MNDFWLCIVRIYTIVNSHTLFSQLITLLTLIPDPVSSVKKILLFFYLIVARNVIARHWKSMNAPTITEWIPELTRIQCLEEHNIVIISPHTWHLVYLDFLFELSLVPNHCLPTVDSPCIKFQAMPTLFFLPFFSSLYLTSLIELFPNSVNLSPASNIHLQAFL